MVCKDVVIPLLVTSVSKVSKAKSPGKDKLATPTEMPPESANVSSFEATVFGC